MRIICSERILRQSLSAKDKFSNGSNKSAFEGSTRKCRNRRYIAVHEVRDLGREGEDGRDRETARMSLDKTKSRTRRRLGAERRGKQPRETSCGKFRRSESQKPVLCPQADRRLIRMHERRDGVSSALNAFPFSFLLPLVSLLFENTLAENCFPERFTI